MKTLINDDLEISQGYHRVKSTYLNMYRGTGDQMQLRTQAARGELIYVLGISEADSTYLDAIRLFDGESTVIPANSIHQCIDITEYNTYQKSIDARGNPAVPHCLSQQSLMNELLELIETYARYRAMGNGYATDWKIGRTKYRKGDMAPLGVPGEYVSGANTDGNFDGPGLVQHVYYTHHGIQLPRTAVQQFELCEPIEREKLQPGDLIFFKSGDTGAIVHVGIALDKKGHYCHASEIHRGICIHSLDSVPTDTVITMPTRLAGKQQQVAISAQENEYFRFYFEICYGRIQSQFVPDYTRIPADNRPAPHVQS